MLLTECKKQKMEYKLVAFESVSRVLESNNLNRFVEFSSLCFPLLNPVCLTILLQFLSEEKFVL